MKKTYYIPNISCKHCIMTITHELEDLDGVISVRGDVESKHVHVEWNPPSDEPLILETLNEIGYPAENV